MKGESTMKNTLIKLLAVAVVAVMLVATLASCGKSLSGAYSSEISLLGQSWDVTYTFKGSKVEAVSKATLLGKVTTEEAVGEYEIIENADGSLEIKIDFEDENSLFRDGTYTLEQGEDYIKIGGVQYNKVEK